MFTQRNLVLPIALAFVSTLCGTAWGQIPLVGGSTLTATPLKQLSTEQGLFKFVKEVKVTTAVDSFRAGGFVRIAYVPGRSSIVVTFKGRLPGAWGNCNDTTNHHAYGYREYTTDMIPTGDQGIISCKPGPDVGGLFAGDDFYYASMGRDSATNTIDGWHLTKYNAVTWASIVNTFFYPLDSGEESEDPMLAVVNGLIDIASVYRTVPPDPFVGDASHHSFFTPNLMFVNKIHLADTPHFGALSSMVTADTITNFITSTAILGDLIVMQYDPNWNYIGTKTLKLKSVCPEGVAFDGNRFYVSYLDMPCTTMISCFDNVRLAAFDSSWNLLDDIAVTNFTSQEKQPNRPTLTLWNNRIYVAWDQLEDTSASSGANNPDSADIQVHVSIYELTSGPSGVERDPGKELPTEYSLEQNYPNPFNPTTSIPFSLPSKSFVSLKVFDALGREVSALVSGQLAAGTYTATWEAAGLSSGVYFCRLQASETSGGQGSFTETKKLILLR